MQADAIDIGENINEPILGWRPVVGCRQLCQLGFDLPEAGFSRGNLGGIGDYVAIGVGGRGG